jgi:raffinose/stachyose/melibiose transport system permease protein
MLYGVDCMQKMFSNKGVIASLVAPGLFMFLFAILAPIIVSGYYSFTNFSGLGSYDFIGWQNFKTLAKDGVFWLSLRNSRLLAAGFIIIQHPLAMITAFALDRIKGRPEAFFRCIYFIPEVISVAVIASLWKFVYDPTFGLLTKVLGIFGYTAKISWLGPGHAIWAVLVTLIWQGFGWGMLIYYTGIKNIDPVLYEAGEIDGCNARNLFLHITLPQMVPVIEVNVTMAIISALKQMETVYLLTNGGPGDETQFAANYLYQQAFSSFRYGYGNSIAIVFIIVCLIATAVTNRAFKGAKEA